MCIAGSEVRKEFRPADSRRSNLTDDDPRREIGEDRRLLHGRARRLRQRERRHHRVSRAAHIEDLAREGRQMNRSLFREERQSLLSAGDQNVRASKFFEEQARPVRAPN